MLLSDQIRSGSRIANSTAVGSGSKGDFVAMNLGDGKATKIIIDEFMNTFNDASTDFIACCKMDTNKFLVVYKNNGDTFGYGRIGVVSGATIRWGTAVAFHSAAGGAQYLACCYVSADKALIAFSKAYTYPGNVIVASASGDTVSYGTAVEYNSTNTTEVDCCLIGTDKVAVAFRDTTAHGEVCVCTISGTTITAGTPVTIDSGNDAFDLGICPLGTDKLMIVYQENASTDDGKTVVATVSGTVPTVGTPVTFHSDKCFTPHVCQLTTDKALVFADIKTNSKQRCSAWVVNVSGTVPTFAKEHVVRIANNQYTKVLALSSTKVIFVYRDSGQNFFGIAIGATVSGNDIVFGKPTVFNHYTTMNIWPCAIDTDKAVVCWEDDGGDDHGQSGVLSISGNDLTLGVFRFGGLAADDFTDTNPVSVVLSGIVKNISSMTFNHVYLLEEGGNRISARQSHVSYTFDGYAIGSDVDSDARMVTDSLLATAD